MVAFLILVIFLGLQSLIDQTQAIYFTYLDRITSIDQKFVSTRFIPETRYSLLPASAEDLENFYFGDNWFNTYKTPFFRNNKFVIRYYLKSRANKTLSETWPESHRKMIREAHASIEKSACVYFMVIYETDVRKEIAHLQYNKDSDKCSHTRETLPSRRSRISLPDDCIDERRIRHETLHAFGFIHEHQRPDRDFYVTIKERHILRKFRGSFRKFDEQSKQCLNMFSKKFRYDYYSIMHYPQDAFTSSDKLVTIIPKQEEINAALMGTATELSNRDRMKLSKYYSCKRFESLYESLKNNDSLWYYDIDGLSHSQRFGYRKYP